MKFYVITAGAFSNYHIVGITLSPKKAITAKRNYNRVYLGQNENEDEGAKIEILDEKSIDFYCSDFAKENKCFYCTEEIRCSNGKTETRFSCKQTWDTEGRRIDLKKINSKVKYLKYTERSAFCDNITIFHEFSVRIWARNEKEAMEKARAVIGAKHCEVEAKERNGTK